MMTPERLRDINDKIMTVKNLLLELEQEADQFPALLRNARRASTSVKMLELNITDIVDLVDT